MCSDNANENQEVSQNVQSVDFSQSTIENTLIQSQNTQELTVVLSQEIKESSQLFENTNEKLEQNQNEEADNLTAEVEMDLEESPLVHSYSEDLAEEE